MIPWQSNNPVGVPAFSGSTIDKSACAMSRSTCSWIALADDSCMSWQPDVSIFVTTVSRSISMPYLSPFVCRRPWGLIPLWLSAGPRLARSNGHAWDSVSWFAEGVAAVEKNGKWGYIDTEGNVVIQIQWDNTYEFHEGVAAVEKTGKWGCIDAAGNVVIEPKWDNAFGFREGLAAVEKDGQWGFIDTAGNVVIDIQWDATLSFYEGLAIVEKDGKYGFIDTAGNVVIDIEWDWAVRFFEGRARVQKDGSWFIIDREGNIIYEGGGFLI